MKSTLVRLHAIFLTTLEEYPDSTSFGHICDSGPLYAAAGGLVNALLHGEAADDAFIAKVREEAHDSALRPHLHDFLGSIYAICAARFLEQNANVFALRLATEASSYSEIDRFAQNIILEVNHRLDPDIPGPQEISEWLKTRFCMFPFTWVETWTSREIFGCCPAFLPKSLGSFDDVKRKGIYGVLNSPAAIAIRDSILDGSFRYCSKLHCPAIGVRQLISREAGLARVAMLGAWPETVMLSHDRSCNLSCPSCRNERIVVPKSEQAEFDSLSANILIPLMDHASLIRITGTGDPFGSAHYRNLLEDYCRRAPKNSHKLNLQTNGLLCDQKAWESIGLYGHVKEIYVSIDAATEETYTVLRRGGDFNRLMRNMRFLADMRRSNEFSFFLQRFVVQAKNFREMRDFVRMGQEFGVDLVEFNLIRNFGTFSPEEFALENIASFDHADYQEFLEFINDPLFDLPIVKLSNVSNFRPKPKCK